MSDELGGLRHPDPETRYKAALRLCGRPLPPGATELLLEMLEDEGRFEEDVGDWYGGPWYEARFVSDAAEQALSRAAADLLSPLQGLLGRGSARARRHAARLLAASVEARGWLLQALDDPDPRVREAALTSLIAMRSRTSPLDDEPLLARVLERVWDPDADVSRAAAEGLRTLSQHPRFPTLVGAALASWAPRMRGPDLETQRMSACRALGLAPDDLAAAALLADVLTCDPSESVLRCAAESLQRTRVALPRPQVETLLRLLPTPRMSYARPPLLTVLVNQHAPSEALAEAALPFALDGAPGIIASAPLFQEVRASARAALRACGVAARPLVPRIAARLDGDDGQRGRALALLAVLPEAGEGAVAALVDHLRRQPGPDDAEATLDAIARLGEAALAAFPVVLACIVPDAHWRVTTAATKAVAAMGDVARHACPAIEAVLARREHQVLVLYAVTEMGRNAAPLVPFLARLAEQSDHREVRRLAREICDRLT